MQSCLNLDQLAGEIETLFASVHSANSTQRSVVADARQQANALGTAAGETEEAACLSGEVLAADLICGLALEHRWTRREISSLMRRVAKVTGRSVDVTTAAVFLRVTRDPRVIELPPHRATETILRTLYCFVPVRVVSLWRGTAFEPPTCLSHVGSGAMTRGMRTVAKAALDGELRPVNSRTTIHAVPVTQNGIVSGALVFRVDQQERDRAFAFARETANALSLVLEREVVLAEGGARERALVESTERRLACLGYDLHDGPLQDIGAATRELHLLRSEVRKSVPDGGGKTRVLEKLDLLELILDSSQTDIRELSKRGDSTLLLETQFRELLEREIYEFSTSTNVRVSTHFRGDFEPLTVAQRTALLQIVKEGLTNVRTHSSATDVRITAVETPDAVRLELTDNGHGFDVEPTLLQAAKKGRLGLVGMSERARLLGGVLDVRSKPGESTTITVRLPALRKPRNDRWLRASG